jgi:metal-responsive CopG/Arc/MetJ family transcriptional regulator
MVETVLTHWTVMGNTGGMKAAVSIPDVVFEEAERLARRLRTSRSHLYARALADFVAQHEGDKVTDSMNRVLDEVGAETDDFTRRAARRTLRNVEW